VGRIGAGAGAATDAQLILGINLEANNLRVSQVEAAEFTARIGRRYIGAFDIGNEPPLYTSIPWYHLLNGRVLPWYDNAGSVVLSRGSTWGPLTFTNAYARIVDVLPEGVPIAGTDTQQASWFAAFVRLLTPHSRGAHADVARLRPEQLREENRHRPAYPSVPHLLGPYASNHLLPGLVRYIQLAHQNGATFRIDEMGSITCNGRWGSERPDGLGVVGRRRPVHGSRRTAPTGVNLHASRTSPTRHSTSRTPERMDRRRPPALLRAPCCSRTRPPPARGCSRSAPPAEQRPRMGDGGPRPGSRGCC